MKYPDLISLQADIDEQRDEIACANDLLSCAESCETVDDALENLSEAEDTLEVALKEVRALRAAAYQLKRSKS